MVEVTRPSADCQTTFFERFKQFRKFFEKSRWTVTRQWSEVTRPSADCQTSFFRRFKQFGKILKKVAERSRDSGRRSRDRRPTGKQRFLDVSSNFGRFRKNSLNGHATVVGGHATVDWLLKKFLDVSSNLGKFWKKVAERSRDNGWGHATVGRLSNNVLWTFQAIRKFFEKSRWTVTRQWSEVTRPSADCQTSFFRRFKQFGKILKKVAERSRDSGRRSRDRRPTGKQRFLDVSSNFGRFRKNSLNGHATVVGGHATVDWLLKKFLDVSSNLGKFWKKVAGRSRDSDRKSRDHRPTVKQRFLDVSSN